MNQSRGVERLPGVFLRHLPARKPAQLGVDQRQELIGGLEIALLYGR